MTKWLSAIVLLFCSNSIFAQCTDLFFSEYVEGSSNNKALEIYNPTSVAINLSGYKIQLYTNGSPTPGSTFNLSGSIAAGDVYVIVNSAANDSIKAVRDTINNGVCNFNGDDAVVLLKGTDTLDIIGVVGNDPGNSWTVGTGSTLDHTLVRADTVRSGTKNWALSATQWVVFPKDTIRLGTHTMSPCNPITDTLVQFSVTAAQVSESAGTYDVGIKLNAASLSSTFTVDVELIGGTGDASDIDNYTTQTVTFIPNTSSQNITLTITDDLLPEPMETLIFRLTNPTGGILIGADSIFTLSIGASDQPVQTYAISQITSLDANFSPDSLGVKVRVSGTVIGIDYRNNGIEFFIHDATDGILIFSPTKTFGYSVAEGDSVWVEGEVGFFNGMTEIQFLDTVYKIGTGVVPFPIVVQDLDETTEAELVRLNNVQLVTPAQWTTGTGASGFSCDITDGQNTWKLRIDEMCALYNQPAPSGKFDVIGIGSQNDNSAPYNSGYQLLPRFASDIIMHSGINETTVGNLKVFPNPNNGQFVIESKTPIVNGTLAITDVTGKLLYSNVVSGQTIMVQTHNLTPGTYIVQVRSNNGALVGKLNVQ
ncbi:MAG: lamin tail domain-containing protein [Chitinophagales bacterium]|nr:lamin tail domain-containing protein [Chitinophagales bacterium]